MRSAAEDSIRSSRRRRSERHGLRLTSPTRSCRSTAADTIKSEPLRVIPGGLPVGAGALKRRSLSHRTPQKPSPAGVLVVEAGGVGRRRRESLRDAGFVVDRASDAPAPDRIKQHFDLIICDLEDTARRRRGFYRSLSRRGRNDAPSYPSLAM